jgi:hypothetical protein
MLRMFHCLKVNLRCMEDVKHIKWSIDESTYQIHYFNDLAKQMERNQVPFHYHPTTGGPMHLSIRGRANFGAILDG